MRELTKASVSLVLHFDVITDTALSSLDEKVVGKWRKYFQLKSSLYLACVSLKLFFLCICSFCIEIAPFAKS